MRLIHTYGALALTTLATQAAVLSGGNIDNTHSTLFARYETSNFTDGAGTNSWNNSASGAGGNLTANQGDVNLIAGTGPGGEDYVDFDGSSSIWGGSDLTGGQYTVLLVARIDADTDGYLFDGTTGSQRGALFAGSTGNPTGYTMFAGSGVLNGTNFTDTLGDWLIHTLIYDNGVVSGSSHSINGEEKYSGTLSVGTWQTLIMGARVNNANKLNGGIAEFLIYDTVLTGSEISDVEGALSNTYGIGLVPEPSSLALLGLGSLALLRRRR